MVTTDNIFLIDSTFIFKNTHETFLSATILSVDGKDTTFIYGFSRELLRLKQSLCINKGILIIGKEALNLTTEEHVKDVLLFLNKLDVPVVSDTNSRVLDICFSLLPKVTNVITKAEEMLQFEKKDLVIIIPTDSGKFDFICADKINARVGVNRKQVPTLLTLTEGRKSLVFTKDQAIRLIELYGDLEGIYKNLSIIASKSIRDKLNKNKTAFMLKYIGKNTTKTNCTDYDQKSYSFDFDNKKNTQLLKTYNFYSLIRLLKSPSNVMADHNNKNKSKSNIYKAVISMKELKALKTKILSSEYCAVDTESNDKNPLNATLFGVSFSIKKNEAFYVPLVENDLKDMAQKEVLSVLKEIFNTPTKLIGHNIKYDYILLRKNGIKIREIHFDTMLAAYDCFGDWDFFNLSFLAKKLLMKKIKSYKEIVNSDQTFLDLPFKKILEHACEDADITLQLYHSLKNELECKKITEQYYQYTIPFMKQLGDFEYNGIQIDLETLEKQRIMLLEKALSFKQSVWIKAGKNFDVNSQSEIEIILKETLCVNELIIGKKMTISLLEQLAINHSMPKLIVNYKRVRKQINMIDSIFKAVKDGKVWPIFNQIKSRFGQLSTTGPSLFDMEESLGFKHCISKNFQCFFKNSKKSLTILGGLSKDSTLQKDNLYSSYPLMKELDIDKLLLLIVIGFSNSKLSKQFLIDQLTITTIRHKLELRYVTLFQWLKSFREQTSRQRFAFANNERKYFDGLKSSNIEKRKKAEYLAVRWLIQY